jgi:hypothetical protein
MAPVAAYDDIADWYIGRVSRRAADEGQDA